MKIIVRSTGGPNLTIPLPNRFLFSPTLFQFINWTARKSIPAELAPPNIPPAAAKELYAAIRKIKKAHKSYCLLDMRNGGDCVKIML